MLYGLAISQSDCGKAGPYQLPCNNIILKTFQVILGGQDNVNKFGKP